MPDLRIATVCRCLRRGIPLRVKAEAAEIIRGFSLPPELELLTWRCPRCKDVVTLRVADLHLAAPVGVAGSGRES